MADIEPADPAFDAELAALRAVIDALTGVPSEARGRILSYAHQRFPAPAQAVPAYFTQQAGLSLNPGLR